jgi:nitroimidazol reductase NimA-like FMN-containing flavoprotein (pyridoxamine 5'-phosphate oxidase superfamily)
MATTAHDANDPGGLSRRITERRTELGMTIEELAHQSGMDPGYLRYVEGHSHARLRTGATLRLSRALEVTPASLCGRKADPLGTGSDASRPHLLLLTRVQCNARLRTGAVGRVLLVTERGPVAHPVNYACFGDDVVISTDVVQADLLESQDVVGFEVDEFDAASREGWSVLVTGSARRVDDPDEIVTLAALQLESWAGDGRRVLVILTATEITGRVIRHPLGSTVEDRGRSGTAREVDRP